MFQKKIAAILMTAALVLSSFGQTGNHVMAEETTNADTTSKAQTFIDLTSDELREDMGAGWNLGNTMDGHDNFTPSETVWQYVKTTKELIKKVHDLGFNTVRIPVTWGTMIDDENDYAINEEWIARVKEIVDYCVSQDMYALINIHHDGAEQTGWLRIASSNKNALKAKFAGVWKHIAQYFKDYDEHLIFEAMNEVKGENMTTVRENKVIMELNQIFVDTVRQTGSNNAKRWLMVTGKYNYVDSICNAANEFSLPDDTIENRLILSVHDYTPWEFCGLEDSSSRSQTKYELRRLKSLNEPELKQCYDTYTSKGIPVVVGEYGCVNKDNPEERAFYIEGMNRLFQKYKLTGIYWDQGWYDRTRTPDYSFSIIDRTTGEPIDKEITDAMMRGRFGNDTELDTLVKSPEVVPITSLSCSTQNVTLKINDSTKVQTVTAPENTNDVVLWKTQDPTVATVAYGKINAKGVGSTVVTAYTQNGTVSQDIQVTVSLTAPPTQTPTESAAPTVAPTQTPKSTLSPRNTTAPKKIVLKSVTKGNQKYTIYMSGTKANTAVFEGLVKKKGKKVTIPDTIRVDGKNYRVTAIAAKACSNHKTLTTLVLGKNVSVIGKEAFAKCKQLKTIQIRSTKLTKKNIAKKAFYKIPKKITVKCSKKKLAAYKKLIQSRR